MNPLRLNSSVLNFYLHFRVGHVDNIYSEQRKEFITLAHYRDNNLFNSLKNVMSALQFNSF